MENIPSAEEFIKKSENASCKEDLIEFTKLHVQAALKKAKDIEVDGCGCGEANIIFNHIDTCYPLENIK